MYLFGQCGCCRGSLISERQAVWARMPWISRAAGVDAGTVEFYSQQPFPDVIYKTLIEELVNPDGTVVFHSENNWDDKTGAIANTGGWTGLGEFASSATYRRVAWSATEIREIYSNGAVHRWVLQDRLTFAEQCASAIALLDQVTLLDPLTVYQFTESSGAAFPGRFCYPSEAAGQGLQNSVIGTYYVHGCRLQPNGYVSRICVRYVGLASGPQIILDPNPFSDISDLIFPNDLSPFAANGHAFQANYGSSSTYYQPVPYLYVCKMAVRSPHGFSRRDDTLKFGFDYLVQPPAPVIVRPGENIFTPADVPGFGVSLWRDQPLPSLPSAKATASETNVTADSTNITADQQ